MPLPSLEIFPGEKVLESGVTAGTLYVRNGKGERYEVGAGPPPGQGRKDGGGHTASFTPPGRYTLDRMEHHTTSNWPSSVVPWGAAIREKEGIIEYQVGGQWKKATGPDGSVTRAMRKWFIRSNQPITLEEASAEARRIFFPEHRLVEKWIYNDFGEWSWNLKSHGHRTAYYIHTTPAAEWAFAAKVSYEMEQSHGCIHIRPADRDEMRSRGYLEAGIRVDVRDYGLVGEK